MTSARACLVAIVVGTVACGAKALPEPILLVEPPAVVPTSATACPPPVGDDAQVQSAFAYARGCVALVDADVSPVTARPTVWRHEAGEWREIPLPGSADDRVNHGWVAAATDGFVIVGVLDTRVESTGPELTIVRSFDGGATWQPPVFVAKPHYFAAVKSLDVRVGGLASITLEIDDDYGDGAAPGTYRVDSGDRGGTWGVVRLVGATSTTAR